MKFSGGLMNVIALAAVVTGAGCAAPAQKASDPGVYDAGKLRITLDAGWFEQKGPGLPGTTARSKTWSREGLEHDRLFVTGGVNDGEPMFESVDGAKLPVFRSGMAAAAAADFVAESLRHVLWNGAGTMTASNVRERGFTGVPGFGFDLAATVPGGADHRGIAGGFVHEGRLYITVYLAESPGYFERNEPSARAVIDSSMPTMKTIRW